MQAWKIRYRYKEDDPRVIFERTVYADNIAGALFVFHSCGAHSDDVVSVEQTEERKTYVLKYKINDTRYERRYSTYEAALRKAVVLKQNGIAVAWQAGK